MDSLFRVYGISFTTDHKMTKKLMGRVFIHDGCLRILEDHTKELHHLLPEGPLSSQTIERIRDLRSSPYCEIVDENRLTAEHLPELNLNAEEVRPDAVFLVKDLRGAERRLEIWPNDVVLDGKSLSQAETQALMAQIEAHKFSLIQQS